MKTFPVLLLAGALTTTLCAQTAAVTPAALELPAPAAVLTAPLVLKDGVISQPKRTGLADGGRAIFRFSVDRAGDYEIHAVVNAPSGNENSFYANIDAPPEDPLMIWGMAVTDGFEERILSWRGNDDAEAEEYLPKVFKLSAGAHQLILVGREPMQLRSISIRPVPVVVPAVEGTLAYLQQRYAQADTDYNRALRRLPDTPESRTKAGELRKKLDADHAGQFEAAVRLAAANPRSKTGFSCMEWVLKIPRSYYLPAGPKAIALVTEQYAQEPAIGGLLATLSYYFPDPEDDCYPGALALLNVVVAANPDRTARGHAALGLAWLAKRRFQKAEWRNDPTELARVTDETVRAFETVVHDYGDCVNLRKVGVAKVTDTLGSEAESELREIRHLSIGQMAPEITGTDTDGAPLKLSDSRGKVVLLVFWASWCGPCMAAVPHEKELVKRFKGRPFVLLGVNGDGTLHDAAKAVRKNEIPWRSFWNGKRGAADQISTAWSVRGWPTVYVLDHQGVIRQKYLLGRDLDEPLEKLVAAAERPD